MDKSRIARGAGKISGAACQGASYKSAPSLAGGGYAGFYPLFLKVEMGASGQPLRTIAFAIASRCSLNELNCISICPDVSLAGDGGYFKKQRFDFNQQMVFWKLFATYEHSV
jgi:hypothetical protein